MENATKSHSGALARFRGWRERRRRAAAKRRAWAEQRVAEERYNYRGPGAPGGGGA